LKLQQRLGREALKVVGVFTNLWTPIALLTASNVFMTFAWYGHLRFKESPIWLAILVSWGIAFFEYTLMIPANRFGSAFYTPFQLKVIQEVITLVVFSIFAVLYLGEKLRWNHAGAAVCLVAAVIFTFVGREP
jgi:uncharacterized protein (DUF486 family)